MAGYLSSSSSSSSLSLSSSLAHDLLGKSEVRAVSGVICGKSRGRIADISTTEDNPSFYHLQLDGGGHGDAGLVGSTRGRWANGK